MEGFGYNPVVYDLVTDMIWRDEGPEARRRGSWISSIAATAAGFAAADEAWKLLLRIGYRQPGQARLDPLRPAQASDLGRPAILRLGGRSPEAWEKLAACAPEVGESDTYRYDLVHVARRL